MSPRCVPEPREGQDFLPAKPPPGSVWEQRGFFSPVTCPLRPPWCPLSLGVGMVPGLRPHTSTAQGATSRAPSPDVGFGDFLKGAVSPEASWCMMCKGGGQTQGPAAVGHKGAFAGACSGCLIKWVCLAAPRGGMLSTFLAHLRVGAALPLLCLSSPGLRAGGSAARAAPLLPAPSWQPPLPSRWHCGLNLPGQRWAGHRTDGRAEDCPVKCPA